MFKSWVLTLLMLMVFVNFCYASAKGSFNEGYRLMQQSLFEQAVASFQKSLSRDPKHTSSMTSLAMCLEKLRRYDDAVRIWRLYDQVKPSGKSIHEHIALLGQMKTIAPALEKGNIAPVMSTLKQILRDPYSNSIIALDAVTVIGHYYYEQNKFSESYSMYSQVISKYPAYFINDVGLYDYAKLLNSQENKYLEATKYLKELSTRPNLTLSRDEVIDLIAENFLSEAKKIEKSKDKDKDKKARILYEKVVFECPTSKHIEQAKEKVGDIAKLVKDRKETADAYFSEGQYSQALNLYRHLIANTKDRTTAEYAQLQTAKCLASIRKYPEAIKAYHNVVRTNPAGPYADDALVYAGCLLAGTMRQPKAALKEFILVMKKYPEGDMVDDALYYTSYVYLRILNEPKKAKFGFAKLLKEHPDSPWVQWAKQRLSEIAKK